MRSQRLLTVVPVLVGVLALGCSDPEDPKTWAGKLKNLREQKEALDRLAGMDVEKARVALPQLVELYKDTKSPEHLQALVRYRDKSTIPVFLEALDYTDEDFDKATIAAGVLADMKATEAVEKLIAAAQKQLPIKSRANNAKLAAIRALVYIGDKRAVPALVEILKISADEQDFLHNQKAALGLAEFRDPSTVPALVQGMFMTGKGTDIFQECRLALVRIGDPAVPALMELFQDKNADIRAMATQYKFLPGIVQLKAAYLLGDLRAARAVPMLVAHLKRPPIGKEVSEHTSIAIALGQIGTPAAVDALIAIVKDGKADPKLRLSATDAIYLSGDRRAVPTLLDVAKSGYVTVDGVKASDLRANAAIDLARIAGPEHYAAFKALADKETEAEGMFGEALDRMAVAKECSGKIECYAKTLSDPSWTRAEKAAFAIGFSGDKAGIPALLGAFKPLVGLSQDRYPLHQALLFALTRLADKTCTECVDKLGKQIARDEKQAMKLPGARGLLAETRVALAVIQKTEPGSRGKAAAAPVEEAAPEGAPAGKAGKGKGKAAKKVASRKGKRR